MSIFGEPEKFNKEDNYSHSSPSDVTSEHLRVKSPNVQGFFKKRDYGHCKKGVLFGLPFVLMAILSFTLFYVKGSEEKEVVSRPPEL